MTDKVQKIREEVERMHNLLPVMDGDNISVNYADRICTTLEMYIDSMQEEPVSEELEEAANDAVISLVPSFGQKYSDGSYVSCIRDSFKREELIKLYKAGAEWQKQKMMKAATDGQMENGEDYLRIKCLCMSCPPQYDGKLVRLIIIKEE